jgi:hypothetical protein
VTLSNSARRDNVAKMPIKPAKRHRTTMAKRHGEKTI